METPKSTNSGLSKTFFEGSILFPKYEKPIKKAFYNGIALILIGACSVFALGSFIILEPFLKPLFWALLCGSVLHPLKHRISSHFKTWIIWVEDTDVRLPILIRIVSCPIKLFLDLSDYVGESICRHWVKILGTLFTIIISGLAYSYTPHIITCLCWKILNIATSLLLVITDLFQNLTMIMTIILAFLVCMTFYWDPMYEKQFLIASYIVWFGLSAHMASYFYCLKLPIFILFQLLFVAGLFCQTDPDSTTGNVSQGEELKAEATFSTKETVQLDGYLHNVDRSTPTMKHTIAKPKEIGGVEKLLSSYVGNNTSDIYISWVTIGCLVTLALQSGWVPYCSALMLIVYAVKHLCHSFGVSEFLIIKYKMYEAWLSEWYAIRRHVLVPAPLVAINMIFIEVRMRLLRLLRESSDSAATVIVILGLVMFLIFGSTFLAVQAYTEGIYMMKVGGSVINQTVVHNPELTQLLPEDWEEKMDAVLNNAYTYGREALSKLVRSMLAGVNEEKAAELETRALEVWDRLYQAWMMNAIEEKTTMGPKVTSSAVYQTWENFVDAMHKTPELVSMSALAKLAQNNMAVLTSGLESLWDLVRGNASLVFSFFLTILTVVFSHSFAVLNFCISTIVFLSALFYLLSSSRNLYKPVEVITALSPVFGSRLALAMENAVKEVLTASFKLALFYGMWTWLIHNLFQMNIVYIPSVLASMLAVVPALGTYWACLPAVLDLWLAQGKKIHAIALAMCQFLPTLFVDATIYTEINEGHPYLTGLSVAGGLFYMGMEGAIIGPLILCCLYVVVTLSSTIMQDTTTAKPSPLEPR